MEKYKKKIKEMTSELDIPDEVFENIFSTKYLEDFNVLRIATFGEFINAKKDTEFVTVAYKYGEERCADQCIPENVEIENGYLSWSHDEGDAQVTMGDLNDLMEKVGDGRWNYSVYIIKD